MGNYQIWSDFMNEFKSYTINSAFKVIWKWSKYVWTGLWFFMVKTDNTAYQALVLVWLGCGKSGSEE